jgi:diguanylate cyclase (GGDEF)-like protein
MKQEGSKLEFVDTVVDLTRHQSPKTITEALLETLRKLIPAQKLGLYALSNENRDTEFNEQNMQTAVMRDLFAFAQAIPFPITDDDGLVRSIRTRNRVVDEKNGAARLIIPIFGALDIWALLVIEGVSDVSKQYEMLARLLRVYSNQMHMLSRSEIDPLTGLYNRQSFYERLAHIAARGTQRRRVSDSDTSATTHCFALLDIDHFKKINDQFGHPYGDEVLVELARQISRAFRHDDMLFRYGGEEFAIVLVNLSLDSAFNVLDRFRAKIDTYTFPGIGHNTVSIGFCAIDEKIDVQQVVKCADKALYHAKNSGRNRVCCYERLVAAGEMDAIKTADTDIQLF